MGDGNGNGTINPSELVNEGGASNPSGGSNHHHEFYAPEQLMVNPSLNDQLSSQRDAMMKSSHEDFYYHFDNGSLFSPFDLDYYPQLIHPVDSRESQVLDTPEAMDEDDDDEDDDDDIDSYDDILLSSSDDEDVDLDDDKSSIPPSTTTHPMSATPSPPPTTVNENYDDGDKLSTPKVSESPETEGAHEPDGEFKPPQSATTATATAAVSESMDDDEEDDDEEDEDEDTTPRPRAPTHPRSASRKKVHAQSGPHRCSMPTSEGGTCGKVFSRPYDLIRHQDTIHSPVRKTFKCDLCGDASKTFSRMDALSRHIRVKHSK
jgi:hypothetical protein